MESLLVNEKVPATALGIYGPEGSTCTSGKSFLQYRHTRIIIRFPDY